MQTSGRGEARNDKNPPNRQKQNKKSLSNLENFANFAAIFNLIVQIFREKMNAFAICPLRNLAWFSIFLERQVIEMVAALPLYS